MGDVRLLATCNRCGKVTRVFVSKIGFICMRSHTFKRESCTFSKTTGFTDLLYTLQQVRNKKGIPKKVWILLDP